MTAPIHDLEDPPISSGYSSSSRERSADRGPVRLGMRQEWRTSIANHRQIVCGCGNWSCVAAFASPGRHRSPHRVKLQAESGPTLVVVVRPRDHRSRHRILGQLVAYRPDGQPEDSCCVSPVATCPLERREDQVALDTCQRKPDQLARCLWCGVQLVHRRLSF